MFNSVRQAGGRTWLVRYNMQIYEGERALAELARDALGPFTRRTVSVT